ncbi:MAG: C1 family peptidase [Acidimicrobiales bacterium]
MSVTPSGAATVDLRPTLPPVHDQGLRGTCLAFAVTAGHEVSRTTGQVTEDLSEEGLYWGCKRIDRNWLGGTTFASAAVALGRWGQPSETDWPYHRRRKEGVAYSPPSRAGGKGWFKSGLRRVTVIVADVRTHLDAGIPVMLGLTLFDTFYRPDPAGHIADPAPGARVKGHHAVLAVGHEVGELLIRNSWGTTWGLGGYAWIGDGYVNTHTGSAWLVDATATAGSASTAGVHVDGSKEDVYGTR